jgi:heavy metal translocating P-type ATPase
VVVECALCGQTTAAPVGETIAGERRDFCCAGCARVYEVASESGLLDQVLAGAKRPQAAISSLAGPRETAYFAVESMWCAGCAVSAERFLRRQPGVRGADVSFASERGRLSYDPSVADPQSLMVSLDRLGFGARLLSDAGETVAEKRIEGLLLQLVVSIAFGMQVMMIYLGSLYARYSVGDYAAPQTRNLQYVTLSLTVPALLVGGWSFLRGAWRALRARTATMDTLVTLGTLSAFGYSAYVTATGAGAAYFDSVVMIVTFVMIGRYLESIGGSRARRDVNALLALQPDEAWIMKEDVWTTTATTSLVAGDLVLVKPGSRVPVDAIVVDGDAAVDESLLTGESLPGEKHPGDTLAAGTLVVDGSVVARVTSPASESRLVAISRLIGETLAAKPPIQRLADRASAWLVFLVLGVAVVSLVVRLALGHPTGDSVIAAVAVLVVACPCALGLATPLALTVSLGSAAREGVIVRNPAALEIAARVTKVGFDKTGTITRGRLSVQQVVPVTQGKVIATPQGVVVADDPVPDDVERRRAGLLRAAAAVEQFSEHPVARAIVSALGETPPPAVDFQVKRGLGSSARVLGVGGEEPVLVGSRAYLELTGDPPAEAQSYAAQGSTVVWVGRRDQADGFIALRDELNPTAHEALARVAAGGVPAELLSGDDPRTVAAISAEVGATDWSGGLTPSDKVARIRDWQEQGYKVAMVGDGVNDAPALAQADLAIAVAGATDLTGNAADVVLTRSELRLVPWFLRLSSLTRRSILENLSWAFAYNLVAIPLAAAGVISPVIAAVLMAASSILVVGNSLRMRRAASRLSWSE